MFNIYVVEWKAKENHAVVGREAKRKSHEAHNN